MLEMGNAKLLLLNDLEQHVHSWVLGLMALSGHKITQDLVPHSAMRLMLDSVSTELKASHPSLKLAIDKVEDYYSLKNAYAYITKHDGAESLKIVLDVPLVARDKDILLYKVKPLELPIKSHQNSRNATNTYVEGTTMVTNIPDYLGVAYNLQKIRAFVELNASDLLDCQDLTPLVLSCSKLWVPKTFKERPSCVTASYLDEVSKTTDLCEHTFTRRENSSTKAFKIADNKYFLSSGTSDTWWLNCTDGSFKRFEACISCVIELNCRCTLITPEFSVGGTVNCPKEEKSVTLKHGINMHLMHLLAVNKSQDLNTSGSAFLPHETQFGLNASIYDEFTGTDQIVARDEELSLNLKALFQNMVDCKLSFASKTDFLHHALDNNATEMKVSLWKLVDVAEVIAISLIAFFLFKLYVRTAVLTKGPVAALLTSTAPTAVKGMAHDFDFVTYDHQTQRDSSSNEMVQWYHSMFLAFGIVLLCTLVLYLLYKCCFKRCYKSQMIFRPDLLNITKPTCTLELVLQAKSTRVSVFISQYPYEVSELTFESPLGYISIRPHFTFHASEIIISWHGTALFLNSLANTLCLPKQVRVPLYQRNTLKRILQHDSVSMYALLKDGSSSFQMPLRLNMSQTQFAHSTPLSQSHNVTFPHVHFENDTATAMLHPPQQFYRTTFSVNEDEDEGDTQQAHCSNSGPNTRVYDAPHSTPLTGENTNYSLPPLPKRQTKEKKVTFAKEPVSR